MSMKKCLEHYLEERRSKFLTDQELCVIQNFLCEVYDLNKDDFFDKVNRISRKNPLPENTV